MNRLSKWTGAFTLIAAFGVIMAGPISSEEMFPEGEGRETLFLVCTQCHALNRMTEAKLTADDWEFTVYDMISRGAPVYERDIEALKKYLIDNFAVEE